jgi:hypothetical protein
MGLYMSEKSNQILQLCDSWIRSVYDNNGGFNIGGTSEQFRLLANDIQFHELSFDELQAACIGLTKVMLFKGMNTVISFDHQFLWSWVAQVLLDREIGYFKDEENDIKKLFSTCIRASLAGIRNPQISWEDYIERDQLLEFNTRELVSDTHLVLAYLSFPLLEATLKKACQNYVDYSGKVLNDFEIRTGKHKKYISGGGKIVSSLGDLLALLYDNVANRDLKANLTKIRSHIRKIDSSTDPFYVIYRWRNSSLHGHKSFPTIGGTVLNISIIIALNDIKEKYDENRERIFERVLWDVQTSNFSSRRPPWCYYPPF